MRQKEVIGRRLGTHRLTRKAAKPGLEMGRNWKVPKGWAEGPIERGGDVSSQPVTSAWSGVVGMDGPGLSSFQESGSLAPGFALEERDSPERKRQCYWHWLLSSETRVVYRTLVL